jgi:succinate dehydrogenase flavin-adding protein (antitoxin of CptAB toxin-antitoxin module)
MLILPIKSAAVWERFLKENEILVYKFMINEIKKHIESPADKIELFKFEDNSLRAWIPKKQVLKTLSQAFELFIKTEEYEYARKTDTLIKQYYIHELLSER